ncbi:HAMP domain-containing protein [Streptomyces monticola]|uniref:histidine kinase n=1 Tax=Streptomyces monticola TaxID=2666263 RepID=A0ABW2JJA6_9ACTN
MTGLRDGDFKVRVPEGAEGIPAELAAVFNQIADRTLHMATEIARLRREVVRHGHLDERLAASPGHGAWATAIDDANSLVDALVAPAANATRVLDAVAGGDLTQRVDLHDGSRQLRGDLRHLGRAVNKMVDQLSLFTGEVTRVAREVGTEGRLGGRAKVQGLSGSWRDVGEAVNAMAGRLTAQVRDIAAVTTSVASGDLTRTVTVEATGELLELKLTVNTMVEQLSAFADEVTRVAREVGTEGQLGGRAQVRGVSGVWKDLTDNVNFMASNLTSQVRNIAQVTTAVANGDLSQKITVDARGEILELKLTVNTMVDQLSAFADEVTRVAREVGTEGNLGGQAQVRGVSGVWKDLTDNVNYMASNLTAQVRNIAQVSTAVAQGDLGKKITVEARGEILELKSTINTMVDQLSAFAGEVTRVAREVGTEGNLGGQAQVRGVSGVWEELTDNVNFMASNLTSQVRNIAQVTTAVANGDLSKKITVDARGEILELKDTVNTMVDQLRAFADEVTRVAREVGTDGRLGGQAQVRGISGVWRDLTDNVNYMASNLTSQVRNIAQVATSVAQGDLSKKIDVDARGEILELKTTINTMVDTLSSFASEVTRVAREVGSEGQLGGQARVEGVFGTWKRLTTNVNELASNLTTQVRAIAEVASSVTQGDMTRAITVEASGEVAELKDNINLMVSNLRETTRAKDWLESNLARLAALMQGHRDLMEVADLILRELTPLVNAQYGAFFLAATEEDGAQRPASGPSKGLAFIAGYGSARGAVIDTGGMPVHGLVRQAALEKKRILVEDAPPDYIKIESGLGEAAPKSVVIIPILFEDRLLGVIELATFSRFSDVHLAFFDQFVNTIGVAINTIIANSRTESLLGESQRLALQLQERTEELQRQQAELQRSNAELEEKAALLATSSQYKSEFLANMSHELRTPLNSLLILARLLSDNPEGHLNDQEVQFATTIHRSGSDLLQLINDILDLSKIEAGRMDVRPKKLPLIKLLDYVHATFRPLTLDRGLAFDVGVGDSVPREIYSDEQRLQQILRNLLSNAVKFTASGKVELRVRRVPAAERRVLDGGHDLLAFAVTDTGIGIPREKLPVIFEAFQQADGTTNRKYGGTGLGLSISREIAGLLGGRIVAESELGKGSTFTLYIPVAQEPPLTEAESAARERAPSSQAPQLPEQSSAHSVVVHGREDGWPAPTKLEAWRSGRGGEVLPGRRVLIVDDDIRNVFALTHVLGRVGMPVLYAENGREAIEILERSDREGTGPIELVLMDIMMPEMDGYETISVIRRTPRLADIPIIALTAKAMPGDREKAVAGGANEYVPKPVDVDQLLTVVCALLDPEGALTEQTAGAEAETETETEQETPEGASGEEESAVPPASE